MSRVAAKNVPTHTPITVDTEMELLLDCCGETSTLGLGDVVTVTEVKGAREGALEAWVTVTDVSTAKLAVGAASVARVVAPSMPPTVGIGMEVPWRRCKSGGGG
jgi:hypothetical protein